MLLFLLTCVQKDVALTVYRLKQSVHKKVKEEIIVKPTVVELSIEMKQAALRE